MEKVMRRLTPSAAVLAALAVMTGCAASGGGASRAPAAPAAAAASVPAPATVRWGVYAADVVPTAANAVTLAAGGTAGFQLANNGTDSVTALGDGTVRLDTSASATTQAMYQLKNAFPTTPTFPRTATVITRAKALGAIRTVELDMVVPTGGEGTKPARVKLNIRQAGKSAGSGLQLDKVDGGNNTPIHPFTTNDAFHTYHVALTLTSATTGSVEVYIDGNDTPVISYPNGTIRTDDAGENYIAFGESSPGTAFQSQIDWVIWTTDSCGPRACRPSQLKGKLPANIGSLGVGTNNTPAY